METVQNKVSEVQLTYINKSTERTKITRSSESEKIFRSIYDANKLDHKEMFYCMYLNRANVVLGVLLVSEGGTAGTYVDPKIIFQGALKLNASGLVLSHNHPSGNTQPSQADRQMTQKIQEGCKVLEFQLLDHIIITSDSYYSFNDEGIL